MNTLIHVSCFLICACSFCMNAVLMHFLLYKRQNWQILNFKQVIFMGMNFGFCKDHSPSRNLILAVIFALWADESRWSLLWEGFSKGLSADLTLKLRTEIYFNSMHALIESNQKPPTQIQVLWTSADSHLQILNRPATVCNYFIQYRI